MEKQDLVAKYPKDISDSFRQNKKLPDGFMIDEGFACAWDDKRYFIHARAVLPLKAFDEGVGFGLWVEVQKEDFMRYIHIGDDDKAYADFKVEGVLANEWPGFEHMKGVRVVVRAVRTNEKVYITEVLDARDPLFEIAMRTSADDSEGMKKIEELVKAYAADPHYNDPF